MLTLLDMSSFMELMRPLMDTGAHGDTFYSTLELKTCYDLLVGDVVEVVKHKEGQELEEHSTQTMNDLED